MGSILYVNSKRGCILYLSASKKGVYPAEHTRTPFQWECPPPGLFPAHTDEVCEWESFESKCEPSQVVIIENAFYGRMRRNRCIKDTSIGKRGQGNGKEVLRGCTLPTDQTYHNRILSKVCCDV